MVDETTPTPDGAAPKKPAAAKPAAAKPATAKAPAAAKPATAKPATAKPATTKAAAAKAPAAAVPAATEPTAASAAETVESVSAAPAAESTAAPAAELTEAPAEAPASTEPAVAPAKKRRIWPFVLAGGIVVFLAVVIGAVLLIVNIVTGLAATPAKAVLDVDRAFETADCDLLGSTTTQDFRDGYFADGAFDCAAWVDGAKQLTINGVYSYQVTVSDTSIDGNTAEVTTTEVDSSTGEPVTYELKYTLVNDGGWRVDYIENITP